MKEREHATQYRFGTRTAEFHVCRCCGVAPVVTSRIDELTKSPTQKTAYDCVSCLNRYHMLWAWASLFWVAFSDLYVRLCSMGVWSDWRII